MMELINENDLQNVCGGGKIAEAVENISLACLIGTMLVASALTAYASAQSEELERRKHPKIITDHVVYVVKKKHFC